MYQALAQSLNASAIYLESQLGIETAFEMGKKFGLPLVDKDKYYGLVLGGLFHGCSPLTMAQAYGTFGNQGQMIEAHLINKIVDSTGTVVYEASPDKTPVISKRTAKIMTSMMLGTFSHGTGITAAPRNYHLAGKTGTTETSFDVNKTNDQWVIGYNPDVVITTWLGFAQTDQNHFLSGNSAEQCALIFRKVANQIMPLTSGKTFDKLYPGIKNAYQTEGVGDEDQEENLEENQFDKFKKKAGEIKDKANDFKEKTGGLNRVIDQIKDGAGNIVDKIKDKANQFFGGN
jgi:penicillin-binding protein 2A